MEVLVETNSIRMHSRSSPKWDGWSCPPTTDNFQNYNLFKRNSWVVIQFTANKRGMIHYIYKAQFLYVLWSIPPSATTVFATDGNYDLSTTLETTWIALYFQNS